MLKLKLDSIKKTYSNGEVVVALKDVSLGFRENEFVSILGPSGCGKTTLLNIIGGLDRYDSGDLIINGMSTKKFRDADWDAYRNRSIGFVFQNYNLIGHQTVLQNVEIALTLSGVSAAARRQRAKKVLADMGLANQIKKKPNQLSGGQMQRVAIARALVNDPDIILADEPTGALDSHNSVQLMEILREIAKTRLVIMVTHNSDLAEEYSTRIIKMLDGEIQSDNNPVTDEDAVQTQHSEEKKKYKKTSMSLTTASMLSFRNLLTKKGRTIITAFAGSIGIIGVALVLALSNGLSQYMGRMQSTTLSGFPITVNTTEQSIPTSPAGGLGANDSTYQEYPSGDVLFPYDKNANSKAHTNILSDDYLNYIDKIQTALPDNVNNVSYTRAVIMNVLAKVGGSVVKYNTAANGDGMMQQMQSAFGQGTTYWQELPDNQDFILTMYDLVGTGSRMPQNKNEVVLVVDQYNRIDKAFFDKLGMPDTENYKLTDFIGKTIFSVVDNNDYYIKSGNLYAAVSPTGYTALYESNKSTRLTVVGILREKKDVSSSYLSEGIAYTTALTDYVVNSAQSSDIAQAQKSANIDLTTGAAFPNDAAKTKKLQSLGADTAPTGINIFPKDYAAKDKIKAYLDEYNAGKVEADQVIYTDMAETISSMTSTLLNTVTYVLTGFAAIALVVSSIMIGIITYVSVIERTKEIGILRSVGARKKDISRVFNAETLIIGLSAGVLGVGISYLLAIPINAIIKHLVGISGIASLSLITAAILVIGSMILTLIAGFLPSRMAAKKDPVIALRTE